MQKNDFLRPQEPRTQNPDMVTDCNKGQVAMANLHCSCSPRMVHTEWVSSLDSRHTHTMRQWWGRGGARALRGLLKPPNNGPGTQQHSITASPLHHTRMHGSSTRVSPHSPTTPAGASAELLAGLGLADALRALGGRCSAGTKSRLESWPGLVSGQHAGYKAAYGGLETGALAFVDQLGGQAAVKAAAWLRKRRWW